MYTFHKDGKLYNILGDSMKYLLYTVLFLLLVLFLTELTFRLIRNKREIDRKKEKYMKVLLGLLFIFSGGFAYLLPYYHAETEALNYALSTEYYRFEERDDALCFLHEEADTVLIFYPGAKVDAYAYSQLLSIVAKEGTDVYVIKEPLHIAFFALDTAENILQKHHYQKIYVGGHSLGGVAALTYADQADGVILLASYPTKPVNNGTRLLSVYGDKDGCLERKVYEESRKYWPESSVETVIAGGNHAQFAQYGFQRGDNPAEISAEQQIRITAEEINRFLHP